MAIYMKYDGIDGGVTTEGYKEWIECNSFQWGIGRGIASPYGAGADMREASAPSVSEVVVTRQTDAASVNLMINAVGGDAKEVKIHITQTDKDGKHVAFMKVVLEETLISGFSQSSGGDRPSESISLNFTKYDAEYMKIDAKFNSTSAGHAIYDIKSGKNS
jgi:type VI secretion system secreted protein Hcp